MGKITRPQMKIVRFGTEDVIATSGISVFSMDVNDMYILDWYLIKNQEGAKAFSD